MQSGWRGIEEHGIGRVVAAIAASGAEAVGQVFRREGEYWTVIYEGTIFRIRDGKGLRYLGHLLSHPDQRIHCGELWSAAARQESQRAASHERTRVAVTKRIKASIAKIATLHSGLAEHLTARIRTGYFCVYFCEPYGAVSWTI
jgi:hypothetical protein